MANTLPFITDQMKGESGAELSAIVDWFLWIEALSLAIAAIICCYTCEYNICIPVVHCNSIISIYPALLYVKIKYPRNRSDLKY